MLKIFCGYGLEHVETSHELDLHHYMHDQDVIKYCEDFLNDIQLFGDDVISVKTNYELAIETFIACSYEQNQWKHCQIIYRDENQQEHLITLLKTGNLSDYPDDFMKARMNMINRRMRYIYKRMRKDES